MASTEQMQYIGIGVLVVAVLWRFGMLPAQISQLLDQWVPQQLADLIKGTPAPTLPDQSAAGCPPQGKCEEFRSNTQCGLCPDGCEWLQNKCRSRGITPQEKAA